MTQIGASACQSVGPTDLVELPRQEDPIGRHPRPSEAQRTLFENDRPVRLGGRALDILIALADSTGEVVSKDELVARVWPKTFVEEDANLRVHVAATGRRRNGPNVIA